MHSLMLFCRLLEIIVSHLSVSQLVFSFCDKLFSLLVKDIEAMDASILKGEPATGKKQQKVTGSKYTNFNRDVSLK